MNSIEPPALAPEDRRRLVVSLLRDAIADPDVSGLAAALQRLCRAVTDVLALRGAAVHLMAPHAETGVAASSDLESRGVAELQFTSNEGPAVIAFRTRRPVIVADLQLAGGRWPGFCSLALERGVTGVFAFPLQEGAVSFGVLELYADGRGPLDGPDTATAVTFARAATELLLDGDAITPAGELDAGLTTALGDRSRIHQAQGMVMVDLHITLAEALARMRARAFSSGTSLVEVADEVIAGTVAADLWVSDDASPDGSSP